MGSRRIRRWTAARPAALSRDFLRAGGAGNSVEAAHYLDLRSIPVADQATQGAELAQQLWYVTTHIGHFDLLKISDDAQTAIPAGETALTVGTLDDCDGPVPIEMVRVKFPDGVQRWILARPTLAMAPGLYAGLSRPPWVEQLPSWMNAFFLGNGIWQWLGLLLLIPLSMLAGRAIAWLILAGLAVVAKRTATRADDVLIERVRRPARIAASASLYWAGSRALALTELVAGLVYHVVFTLLVVASAWGILRVIDALADWRRERIVEGADDPELDAVRRASRTRVALFERLAAMAIVFVSTAVALLQFEVVRGVGESLLASAGLAGVVLGFAAQRSLGAIIGGIQLSMSQPIRIGDSVFVEGEYGVIDHVFLTHVVVRRWDDRRVVFPVSRFLDQPFQNLSKFGTQQTGAVTFSCAPGVSLEALRAELRRVCESSSFWDRRVCLLEMTDFSPSAVTLRALVSASGAVACEKLQTEVREHLATWLGAALRDAPGEGRRPGAVDSERRRTASSGR